MRKLSPSRQSPLLAPSFPRAAPKCQVPAMCYGPNKLLGPRRAGPGHSLRSRARGRLQLGREAGWVPLLSRDGDAPQERSPGPCHLPWVVPAELCLPPYLVTTVLPRGPSRPVPARPPPAPPPHSQSRCP